MALAKAMATVAGLTGVSRIAGFLRDILSASILGAGPVADAFFIALRLPNFFRRVTAEGAFSVSFVPVYTEVLEKKGQAEADKFAGNAFMILLMCLSVFCLLAMLAMPWVIYVLAPGFVGDPSRFDLAVELSRITFPYLLFMSLSALLGGILNALGRFAPFAVAPVFFNLCLIGGLLLSSHFETVGHGMAWGLASAGIFQLLWLGFFARQAKVHLKLKRPKLDARTKKVFKLMGPGVIGAGVMHINLFADMIIASFLGAGAISYLYYADRLNQLPLGIVGVAVGTALLPMLSRAMVGKKMEEARHLYNRALEYCLLLALPVAVGLFSAGWPIVVTLFRHGEFTWADAAGSAGVLMAYSVAIPAYIATKVFATAFWAKQDTTTPVKISIVTTILNIVMSAWFSMGLGWGVVGIAAATSITGWLQIILYVYALRGRKDTKFDAMFLRNGFIIIATSAVMAGVVYGLRHYLDFLYVPGDEDRHIEQILALGAIVGAGGLVYVTGIFGFGVVKMSEIRKFLFNKKAKA